MRCNRTFYPQVAATTLTGTTGNNVLNAPGSVSSLVQGLAGADTITLSLVNDEAQGGKGADLITLTASGTIASTVSGGAGNDSVNFTGATAFSGYVDLGAGADTIQVLSTASFSNANVYGGEGADTLTITNALVGSTSVLVLALISSVSLALRLLPPLWFSVVSRKTPSPSLTAKPLPSPPSAVVKALTSSL